MTTLDPTAIRVVRGAPTDTELAAVIAVLYALTQRSPNSLAPAPRPARWTAGHATPRPPTSWRDTPGPR
ncbi:acyl-CoA carboxylase subunit epsilon [Yinghuangia sp. ASG 101]|uniref:acyl-CoA carboxylase subunit epsilon n=1 Tax=Yinghuangia sp. ASG 101 TaxID=2896848 RepID=UPI001E4DF10B|nr:acyl-CoA carboxylase subunit epsilon [Yinghuangia sp. ASG 101]UGQ12420.1 acyl-CoA carboxylase subunit epsilon [Yinghuangia sp. ASG 101]